MRALTWQRSRHVSVETVPDPKIIDPGDCIIQVSSTAICGSDLHLYDGFVPSMMPGDIMGHEFMGEVVEVGTEVRKLKVGDRVVVPFPIACGKCWFCQNQLWSLCDNSNPKAELAEAMYGYSPAGIFGYSHLTGGFAGGQAEYVRVPFADVGPLVIDKNGLTDEQVLFLSDIFPTGYMAAEAAGPLQGKVVAVWGCGPVGQFAIQSARLLGAERIIAIDRITERLEMAQTYGGAQIIHREDQDVVEILKQLTGGRGPDVCIEAVGMEAHIDGPLGVVDRVKQSMKIETGRPAALREAIQACRKGGVVSVAGVFAGFLDTLPFGAAFNKGLTFHMGQTHVHRYMRPLLEYIQSGAIDPSFVVTHRLPLEQAPDAYELFQEKEDSCVKVVLKP
jgi:threonine dehydrogenase-like Zn-dependent dehydrogenase